MKNWFGKKWPNVNEMMGQIKDCRLFSFYAAFGGVEGYPVVVWYESYHGKGSWKWPEEDEEEGEEDKNG